MAGGKTQVFQIICYDHILNGEISLVSECDCCHSHNQAVALCGTKSAGHRGKSISMFSPSIRFLPNYCV